MSSQALALDSASPAFDEADALLWATLRLFEEQALRHYSSWSSAIQPDTKLAQVALIREAAPDWAAFEQSVLRAPMHALLESSERIDSEPQLWIVQGLVYERVRHVIYRTVEASPGSSERTRHIAARGAGVSATVARAALVCLKNELIASGQLFSRFVEYSDDVLHKLDAVGECVDESFGQRFELRFSEVVGEFVADLVPACVELGMDRRKVMGHLAGALMGL